MRKILLFAIIPSVLLLASCKKDPETFQSPPVSEYYPLVVGKYITYQLDSLRYINFGTRDTTISYQVKHTVDALTTDALGRPAYRIIRSIRKTPANPWTPDNTFMAVPTDFAMEFIENNLRFLKMKAPIRNGSSWKGNTYIDTYSFGSDLKYLAGWDYTFDSVDAPITLGAFTLDSTLKINQRDEVIGNPGIPTAYSERNLGIEKYAKGIGMIYRRFLHQEYQPPTTPGGSGKYSDFSYGVTMTMIDHN